MGKHGVARTGLLIGEDQQIGQRKQSDGNKLHELHAAVEVNLQNVGELRERGGGKQRAAERRHDGSQRRDRGIAQQPSKPRARRFSSITRQRPTAAMDGITMPPAIDSSSG